MSKVFVISDTWFNRPLTDDKNINVVDSNDYIISNWNDVVTKNDDIYVLGGFGIADLYHIVTRLNGRIHFLDNYFSEDEKHFIEELKSMISKSNDEKLSERIIFENKQIIILNDLDSILSYLPLNEWPGKSTGTFCFHGINDDLDIANHNISCTSSKWECIPVDIESILDNVQIFQDRI